MEPRLDPGELGAEPPTAAAGDAAVAVPPTGGPRWRSADRRADWPHPGRGWGRFGRHRGREGPGRAGGAGRSPGMVTIKFQVAKF